MEDDLGSTTSTGPTSPEGKARSARNAEKHGMYTNAVLLHYESAEDFAALCEDYYRQFSPNNRAEFGAGTDATHQSLHRESEAVQNKKMQKRTPLTEPRA